MFVIIIPTLWIVGVAGKRRKRKTRLEWKVNKRTADDSAGLLLGWSVRADFQKGTKKKKEPQAP